MMKWNLDSKRKIVIPIAAKEKVEFRLKDILAVPGRKISLKKDFDPGFTGGYKDKKGGLMRVSANVARLSDLQERLYAQDTRAVLIIFQAMDAAGKDGAIRHVMSGVNPQGCHVTSFKAPSSEELDHDYLWRAFKALPAKGMMGIFNRSYYEEVIVVRVHPELLDKQKLAPEARPRNPWKPRFKEINNFEEYLVRNGTVILKFFLNVSKEEQKKRFLARIDEAHKNWKFSVADFEERSYWNQYQEAFEEMLNETSTDAAPWFVIPADNKWFARLAVSESICTVMEQMDLKFPKVTDERHTELLKIKAALGAE
jgi:PPK2 family polyphosphate:nucleotide phosphotransferase